MELKQAKEIYEGFLNLTKNKLNLSQDSIEKMAKLRYDICKTCEERNLTMDTCNQCGCFLPAKTRSPHSECPLKHWKSISNE